MKKFTIILINLFVWSLLSQTLFAAGITLKKDTRYKVKNGSLVFKKGTTIAFHKKKVLKSGQMVSDLIYTYSGSKIVFKGAPSMIYFHKNGMIDMGVIDKVTTVPTKVGKLHAKAKTGIGFHDNGLVRIIILNDNAVANKIVFRKGKQLYFHKKNGAISEGTLGWDSVIGGLTFKKDTRIYFHENGKVKEGTLAKGKTVKVGLLKKKKLKAGSTYKFDSKGKVK